MSIVQHIVLRLRSKLVVPQLSRLQKAHVLAADNVRSQKWFGRCELVCPIVTFDPKQPPIEKSGFPRAEAFGGDIIA